jgi:hypothetical protein
MRDREGISPWIGGRSNPQCWRAAAPHTLASQPFRPAKFVNQPVNLTKLVVGVTTAGLTFKLNVPVFLRVVANPVTNDPA